MLGGLLSVHLSSGCLLSSPIRRDPLVVETWAIWGFDHLLRGECAAIIFKTNTFKHGDAGGYRSCVVASSAVKGKESRLSDWSLHPWPDTRMNLLRLHSWVLYSGMFWKWWFLFEGNKEKPNKVKLPLSPLQHRINSAQLHASTNRENTAAAQQETRTGERLHDPVNAIIEKVSTCKHSGLQLQ